MKHQPIVLNGLQTILTINANDFDNQRIQYVHNMLILCIICFLCIANSYIEEFIQSDFDPKFITAKFHHKTFQSI